MLVSSNVNQTSHEKVESVRKSQAVETEEVELQEAEALEEVVLREITVQTETSHQATMMDNVERQVTKKKWCFHEK